jgi:hypothetical protein
VHKYLILLTTPAKLCRVSKVKGLHWQPDTTGRFEGKRPSGAVANLAGQGRVTKRTAHWSRWKVMLGPCANAISPITKYGEGSHSPQRGPLGSNLALYRRAGAVAEHRAGSDQRNLAMGKAVSGRRAGPGRPCRPPILSSWASAREDGIKKGVRKATVASDHHSLSQWPSEAKFVAIRIGQVEEPLAPFGIARRRVWSITSRDHARIEGVNVGMVEDDTPPPRPPSLRRLRD